MSEKILFDEFVEKVALESGFDFDTAHDYVEAMFETIVEKSVAGETIKIRQFGSFIPRWYKAKRGINPQTKQALDILPHYHMHYAVSKGLENTLNSGKTFSPITLEKAPSLFRKLVTVTIVALLIALIYRSYFIAQEPTVLVQATVTKTQVLPTVQTLEEALQVPALVEEALPVLTKTKTVPSHYRVAEFETLSQISQIVYSNSIYWPLLYQSNVSLIATPDKIYTGTNLLVPKKSESITLYKAYLLAFKSYLKADKMGQSFWTLCSGARYLGGDFAEFLKRRINDREFSVVKRCIQER